MYSKITVKNINLIEKNKKNQFFMYFLIMSKVFTDF